MTVSPKASAAVVEPSDTLAGAPTLIAGGTFRGDTSPATTEPGEPLPGCAPAGKTVWYRFAPPASGVLTVSTADSLFDTVLAIYSGASLTTLMPLACNDDASADLTSEVLIAVSAEQTYAIQLGGYDGWGGTFALTLSLDTSRTALPSPTLTTTPTPFPTNSPTPTATVTPTVTATATAAPSSATAILAGVLPAGPGLSGSSSATGPSTAAGTASPWSAGEPRRGAPATETVPVYEPSATGFRLPNGQPLSVVFDAAAINALRVALPSVAAVRLALDPAPVLENEVQRGSQGGGSAVPLGHPFELSVDLLDTMGQRVHLPDAGTDALLVTLRLPLPLYPPQQSPQRDHVSSWLQALYERGDGGFLGYVRRPAIFDPPTGTLRLDVPLAALASTQGMPGTLFLPARLVPAWVQNFDPEVHIYSGPTAGAVDYGVAGPQFTTFTVVAPQVAGRLHVFNPVTQNYGWIDAGGVGPAGPPADGG
ncbi:MAG: hypothetical protein HY332_06615 [Chloroflexi bacterium]|nr:hypothetical protein [Chloroflexota bacterium]